MRKIIHNILEKCVGCNRCLRVCPIEEASITSEENGEIIVGIDNDKCIACGACLAACHHGSRYYEDDTVKFFDDLKAGVPISLIAAPAVKTNFGDWGRVLSWLRERGVKKVYDVSLGADICTWGYVRYIQKCGTAPMISQPCPAIVNYILLHRNELLRRLSPVQSPMLCMAIYMQKHEKIDTKIAALSPCAAKSHEFEATGGIISYNVTIKRLYEYMEANNVELPSKSSGFDHYQAGLGSLFPMPGGLRECLEYYVGKKVRVDRSEGPGAVYKDLTKYGRKQADKLPVVFDVLNCQDGCNSGTGCRRGMDIFDINTMMDNMRKPAINNRESKRYLDELFDKFDAQLQLNDFMRKYTPTPVREIEISMAKIEEMFNALGKNTEEHRRFDCGACGNDTCRQMVEKIAKGINIPHNCNDYVNKGLKDFINLQWSHFSHLVNRLKERGQLTEDIKEDIASISKAMLSSSFLTAKEAKTHQ